MPRPRRTSRGVAFVLVVTAPLAMLGAHGPSAGTGPSAAFAQTLDDLEDAREVVEGFRSDLDVVTARYEDVWADIERARVELARLRDDAVGLERAAAAAEQRLGDRARSVFKRGTNATLETLLSSEGSQATVERAGLLAALQLREQVGIEQALAGRVALEQTRSLIVDREQQLDALQAELEAVARSLQTELVAAQAEVDTIASLVSRQRRLDRGAQQGIYSCIFDLGVSNFRDTWGAPRSGGRRHKGTDVFAPHRVPVYAITSGVIERQSNSRLGGLGLYLRGDDRNLYYYAHLDSIEAAGRVGNRVTAGELVARNGSSGNADRWAPHVHFELHPGGGAPINPYPWLAAACF